MRTWSPGTCLKCKQYPQMSDATICLNCHRELASRPPPLPKKSKPSQNCDRQICRRCGVVGGHSELCREPIINKATASHRLRVSENDPPKIAPSPVAKPHRPPSDFIIISADRPQIIRYRISAGNRYLGFFFRYLEAFERVATTKRILIFTSIFISLYLTSAAAFAYTENRSLGVCFELGSKSSVLKLREP